VTAITAYLANDVLNLRDEQQGEPPVQTEPPTMPLTTANGATITTVLDSLDELSDEEVAQLLSNKMRASNPEPT
jgi:hypothetical protein